MLTEPLYLRLQRRDPQADQVLADVFTPSLLRYLRRIVGNTAAADDITQDVLLRFLEHRPNLESDAHLRSWLHRVAYNLAAKHHRRRQLERAALSVLAEEDQAAQDPEKVYAERESHERAIEAAKLLREPFRETFFLCAVDGLDYATVAKRLGCPKKTVNTRMFRAWTEIRGRMKLESRDE